MPEDINKHALQCGLDAGEYGLWIGTMNPAYPLMRYHTYEFLLAFFFFSRFCYLLSLFLLLFFSTIVFTIYCRYFVWPFLQFAPVGLTNKRIGERFMEM